MTELKPISVERFDLKSNAWGIISLDPSPEGTPRFFTGYIGYYDRKKYKPEFGVNATITGGLHIGGVSRGRSSVSAICSFFGDEHVYEMGAKGMSETFRGLQDGDLKIVNGHIYGQWTFQKMGSQIYLMPVVSNEETAEDDE